MLVARVTACNFSSCDEISVERNEDADIVCAEEWF